MELPDTIMVIWPFYRTICCDAPVGCTPSWSQTYRCFQCDRKFMEGTFIVNTYLVERDKWTDIIKIMEP